MILGGGLLALCILGAIVSPSASETPPVQLAAGEQSTAPAEQADPEPSATTKPSATPRPTSTPAPTATPEPTNTPEPPTATPEPVILAGTGQTVTDPFNPPAELSRLTLNHRGSSNFIVKAYTPDGNEELLVNTIGSYGGSRPLIGSAGTFLEITADGPWTVEMRQFGFDPSLADGIEGTGDVASDFFEPAKTGPVPFTFSHNGESNFIVYLHCAGGSDLAQNEIGAVQGSAIIRVARGPCFWDVRADGAWSVKPK